MNTLDSGTVSGNSEITQAAVDSLKGSAPWMKFMAILGFIGAAFMVIGGLMMMAAGDAIENAALIGVLYIAFAGVYFYVSYILLQWSNSVTAFALSRDPGKLELAFAKQKAWWMTIGILTIAAFALMIVAMIAGVNMMSQEGWGR